MNKKELRKVVEALVELYCIDDTIRFARKHPSDLATKLIAHKTERREQLVWVFDLDWNILNAAWKEAKKELKLVKA